MGKVRQECYIPDSLLMSAGGAPGDWEAAWPDETPFWRELLHSLWLSSGSLLVLVLLAWLSPVPAFLGQGTVRMNSGAGRGAGGASATDGATAAAITALIRLARRRRNDDVDNDSVGWFTPATMRSRPSRPATPKHQNRSGPERPIRPDAASRYRRRDTQ